LIAYTSEATEVWNILAGLFDSCGSQERALWSGDANMTTFSLGYLICVNRPDSEVVGVVTECLIQQYPRLSISCAFCFEKDWRGTTHGREGDDLRTFLNECTGSDMGGFPMPSCTDDDHKVVYPYGMGEAFGTAYTACIGSTKPMRECLSTTCPTLSVPCAECFHIYRQCVKDRLNKSCVEECLPMDVDLCDGLLLECVGLDDKAKSRDVFTLLPRQLGPPLLHDDVVDSPIVSDLCSLSACGNDSRLSTNVTRRDIIACFNADDEEETSSQSCVKSSISNLTERCVNCLVRAEHCGDVCMSSTQSLHVCLKSCYDMYVNGCIG